MAKTIATCMICGKEYEVCKKCPSTTQYTPWRKMCDTEDHFKLLMLYQDYRDGITTAEEAKDQLDYLGITPIEIKELYPVVQELLLPLFDTKGQSKKSKNKYTDPAVDVKSTEDTICE